MESSLKYKRDCFFSWKLIACFNVEWSVFLIIDLNMRLDLRLLAGCTCFAARAHPKADYCLIILAAMAWHKNRLKRQALSELIIQTESKSYLDFVLKLSVLLFFQMDKK